MINIEKYPLLNHMETLKRISKDENGVTKEYMTESEIKAINFDKVKEEYAKAHSLSTHPKSNDALYVTQGETDVFIEFKNGYISKGKEGELKEKIYDSLLLLNDIINQNISYTRNHLNYILVYNEKKNDDNIIENPKQMLQDSSSREIISQNVFKLAKDRKVSFGLEKFKGYCFQEVATYTKEEFENEFVARMK